MIKNTPEGNQHIKIYPFDAYDILSYKKAITLVRNFTLHDRFPLLTERELEEQKGTQSMVEALICNLQEREQDARKRKKSRIKKTASRIKHHTGKKKI